MRVAPNHSMYANATAQEDPIVAENTGEDYGGLIETSTNVRSSLIAHEQADLMLTSF